MGRYLGSWKIDDVLRVHVQTSSVTSGAATDADAAPSWRVYEDDTATPVTTGSFSTLNAQTGFYVANITLASAIGYEKGKQYAVRTQATVGGVIGADVHSFQIEAEVDANSVSVAVDANAVTIGSTARAQLVDDIWDEPKAGHTTADTYGEYLDATVGAIAASVTANSIGAVTVGATAAAAIAALVDTTVGATAQAAIADAVWDEPKAGHVTADTYGEYLDSTTGAIKADTAAIKAKTDSLTFTVANQIDANVQSINDVTITGDGQTGTEFGV